MVRRRTFVIVIGVLVFMIAATVAVAVWFSSQETATSNFSATSVGEVDIGDAATVALFDATDIDLGWLRAKCIVVEVDATGVMAGDWRIYSGAVTGDLANNLAVTIQKGTIASTTPGIGDCGAFVPDAGPALVGAYPLDMYGSNHGSFATGHSLGAQSTTAPTYVALKITMQLPNNAANQLESSGQSASASWIIENQIP